MSILPKIQTKHLLYLGIGILGISLLSSKMQTQTQPQPQPNNNEPLNNGSAGKTPNNSVNNTQLGELVL